MVRHICSSSMMDDVLNVDLLGRVSSDSSCLRITCSASKIGTFVNKDFTSKLIIMVLFGTCSLLTFPTKCEEFLTKEEVLPVSGVMIPARC